MTHRIEPGQIYRTCCGHALAIYPESVEVVAYEPGARTVDVRDDVSGTRHTIPASYFHATRETATGARRKTGYYWAATVRPRQAPDPLAILRDLESQWAQEDE